MQIDHGPYQLTRDLSAAHLRAVHAYLAEQSYWARGRSLETVALSLQNSECFFIEREGALVGFARAITDRATFAYLADVFVLPEHRGCGLGKWLVEYIVERSELHSLAWLLATADAHALYGRFGFAPAEGSTRYMRRPARETSSQCLPGTSSSQRRLPP